MKSLFILAVLVLSMGTTFSQDYKSQIVTSDLSKSVLLDNAMNWVLGYSRTDKIDKLKAESSSGESISGDEDFIHWNTDNESNVLISNKVKYSKDVLIKYNVQVKVKENKALIIVKNVFWKNPRFAEKYPYIPIEQRGYPDSNMEYSEKAHQKILDFFNDYITKEVFTSLRKYLIIEPEQYENW